MTTFLLIRHGEANYKPVNDRNFIGHGLDLAPLSELGISQIKQAAKSKKLKDSEIILTSPYTRALQSAAIISKELDLDIIVEVDLHEWIPDIVNFQHKTTQQCMDLAHDYNVNNGVHPQGEVKVWETLASVKKRTESVLSKYHKYNKVIVVCHGMVIKTQKEQDKIKNGEIIRIKVTVED